MENGLKPLYVRVNWSKLGMDMVHVQMPPDLPKDFLKLKFNITESFDEKNQYEDWEDD